MNIHIYMHIYVCRYGVPGHKDGEFEELIARAQGIEDDQEAPKRGRKVLAC